MACALHSQQSRTVLNLLRRDGTRPDVVMTDAAPVGVTAPTLVTAGPRREAPGPSNPASPPGTSPAASASRAVTPRQVSPLRAAPAAPENAAHSVGPRCGVAGHSGAPALTAPPSHPIPPGAAPSNQSDTPQPPLGGDVTMTDAAPRMDLDHELVPPHTAADGTTTPMPPHDPGPRRSAALPSLGTQLAPLALSSVAPFRPDALPSLGNQLAPPPVSRSAPRPPDPGPLRSAALPSPGTQLAPLAVSGVVPFRPDVLPSRGIEHAPLLESSSAPQPPDNAITGATAPAPPHTPIGPSTPPVARPAGSTMPLRPVPNCLSAALSSMDTMPRPPELGSGRSDRRWSASPPGAKRPPPPVPPEFLALRAGLSTPPAVPEGRAPAHEPAVQTVPGAGHRATAEATVTPIVASLAPTAPPTRGTPQPSHTSLAPTLPDTPSTAPAVPTQIDDDENL
jgi:hypothetical protein